MGEDFLVDDEAANASAGEKHPSQNKYGFVSSPHPYVFGSRNVRRRQLFAIPLLRTIGAIFLFELRPEMVAILVFSVADDKDPVLSAIPPGALK